MRIAIGLGSNLGDRLAKLQEATKTLTEEFLEEAKFSKVYESEPWGIKEQPKFLNAVITGYCDWKPPGLLNYLKNLERDLGRTAAVKNGPRVLDLDLLCFGEELFEAEGLKIPHPGIPDRDFVLLPLNDVWPEWKHPALGITVSEMISAFQKMHAITATPVIARA